MTTKILDLVLKGKWYDMIASGQKTEEYREIKPYWEKRLLDYEAIKRDYEMLMFRRFLVGKGVDPLDYPRGFTHYCGCEIDYKDMQVDHIKPKCRNNETMAEKRLGGVGEDSIENFNPSCRMCNFYKGMSTIEQFRKRLAKDLDYKRTFATRLALKFGILTEKGWDGKFYFERL